MSRLVSIASRQFQTRRDRIRESFLYWVGSPQFHRKRIGLRIILLGYIQKEQTKLLKWIITKFLLLVNLFKNFCYYLFNNSLIIMSASFARYDVGEARGASVLTNAAIKRAGVAQFQSITTTAVALSRTNREHLMSTTESITTPHAPSESYAFEICFTNPFSHRFIHHDGWSAPTQQNTAGT